MMMRSLTVLAAAAACLPWLAGCGDSDLPPRAPASGVVLYQGKPVENAEVTFINPQSPRNGSGVTDDQGRFQIGTYGSNDGAVPGSHMVTVVKVEKATEEISAQDAGADYGAAMRQAAAQPQRTELPQKYATPATTDLKVEVTEEGPNEFTLELN